MSQPVPAAPAGQVNSNLAAARQFRDRFLWALLVCLAAGLGCDSSASDPPENIAIDRARDVAPPTQLTSRRFEFVYDCAIHGLPAGSTARVWIPIAQTTRDQCVQVQRIDVPAAYRLTTEPRFGNRLLYFETRVGGDGRIPVRVEYRVERFEVTLENSAPAAEPFDRYLSRSTLALPKGETLRQLAGKRQPAGSNIQKGRVLYDAVDRLLAYDKSRPGWGRGDVAWACDAGGGNCSDFHSVFIAACHDLEIPARFEVGFPIPPKLTQGAIDGYHCWARFAAEGRWLAVDISEADKHPDRRDDYFGRLTPDRIQFTVGRDLVLEPPQQADPLNFLVYPYVEVDGQPHADFEKRFRFTELQESVCDRSGFEQEQTKETEQNGFE